MGDQEESNGKLWNDIERLKRDDFEDKKERRVPRNCFSCCDTKDNFEWENEKLQCYYKENVELKKALKDLFQMYNNEKRINKENRQKIRDLEDENEQLNIVTRGIVRELKDENKTLRHDNFLLKKQYDFERGRLELELKHQKSTEQMLTKAKEQRRTQVP